MLYSDTAQPTAEPLKDCKIVILVNIPRERYDKSGPYIETTDEAYEGYMQYISTCAFVQTLKERGMDVDTKVELGSKDLEDLPQAQGRLFATWLYNFQGLEAGVVVFLPGDEAGEKNCLVSRLEKNCLVSSLEKNCLV